jgi:hypothetical protein
MVSKCLRCGAGSEWIQGRVPSGKAGRIEELEQALEQAREVLGVIGAMYQRQIGPYVTQAQKVGQVIADLLDRPVSTAEGK